MSLVDFSNLEADEILGHKWGKGGQKWLLVSFRNKDTGERFGRFVFRNLKTDNASVIYKYIVFQNRTYTFWLPALSQTSKEVEIPR